jgi:hypothetical protein
MFLLGTSFMTVARAASRSLPSIPTSNVLWAAVRSFSSKDWSVYYKIEANNAARKGATQLTVSGPDIDGILANMTVALAMKGCSLLELHAGSKSVDTATHHHVYEFEERPMIFDVFYVVDRRTGHPFDDQDLEPLAKSLLESLKTPMNLVGLGATSSSEEDYPEPTALAPGEEQITIVKSTDAT